MLGKLIKYEWKGYRLPIIIMLIILAGTTALTCGVILTINPRYDEVLTGYSVMALVFSIFLYYFGIIGCTVGMMLIVSIRFYKTCYTDQGYLTHTLPVTPRQLLNAKLITAILTYLLILAAIVGTVFIIMNVTISHVLNVATLDSSWTRAAIREGISEGMSEFAELLGISPGSFWAYLIITAIIGSISSIISVFGCVSLGQLYAKHRVLGAIAAYFVLQFIQRIAGYLCTIPMYARIIEAESHNRELTFFDVYSPSMVGTLIISIAIAIALYFANLHMMTKRLNLE